MFMKKKGFYLTVVLLLCMFVSPLMTNAATGIVFGSTDTNFTSTTLNSDETASSGSISIENNGSNSSFYLGVKAVDALPIGTQFTAQMKMGNSSFTFTSCARMSNSGWSVSCSQSETDPTIINVTATSTAAMTVGQKVAIARVNLDGSGATTSTEPCTITLSTVDTPVTPSNPTCQIDGDTYYCANGQVCTEEEYNAQCTTTPENPQTGSFLPYAVIVSGIAVAVGLYMFTKKNKIYHI